jgi:two-component system LytT family response regulator
MLLAAEPGVRTVLEARNGREAVALIRQESPDLVLLDIQMPRLDGMTVVETVGAERMPAVVFVTAHDRYAIRAFELSAVDYLLKPVTEERFRLAFRRAIQRVGAADDSVRQMRSLLESMANPRRRLERLAIRAGEKTLFVPVGEVDWFEAAENYVRIHTGTVAHLLHVPLNTLEASLDPAAFLRIHRSAIVNVNRIRQLWTGTHGQYVVELQSGVRLPSGRTYGERIRTTLGNPF